MRPKKREQNVQFTLRLSADQANRFEDLKKRLNLKSQSDVFDYLVTLGVSSANEQQDLVYSLIDRLEEGFDRKLRSLNTVVQLNVALTDTFIKFAASTLPEVPAALRDAARFRGNQAYQRIMLTAVREFHRRRQSDAYDLDNLVIPQAEESGKDD
jgi:hypothetical protein